MPLVSTEMPELSSLAEHARATQIKVRAGHAIVPAFPTQSLDKVTLGAKILQSEQRYAMLVRRPVAKGEGHDYSIMFGDAIYWLQKVESTTGATHVSHKPRKVSSHFAPLCSFCEDEGMRDDR